MIDSMSLHGGATVYSPWFPRGGDFLTLTADVVRLQGANTGEIRVFHKNRDEPGNGSEVDSSGSKYIELSALGV
jgi:hypothetical protein